jgi:hypothetical protein
MTPNPAALTLLAMSLDNQIAQLREEVADLEALVRWFARGFTYEDPATGETVVQDPVWTFGDLYGNQLEESKRLAATWRRVARFPGNDAGEEGEPAGDSRRPYTERG